MKLYPSVPRKKGKEACAEGLQERHDKNTDRESTGYDGNCLGNNIFYFNQKHYVQKKRVAKSSKLGENYAYSSMRKFDENGRLAIFL